MGEFVVNRKRPSLWCRLFHKHLWVSNDWGTWHITGRTSFEVKCYGCGGCWTQEVDQ